MKTYCAAGMRRWGKCDGCELYVPFCVCNRMDDISITLGFPAFKRQQQRKADHQRLQEALK